MELIKNVVILEKVMIYNSHHDKDYFNKKGVMLIELANDKKYVLDLESMNDITDSDYLEVKVIKGKTKMNYLFKNILFDTERLERLAKGK